MQLLVPFLQSFVPFLQLLVPWLQLFVPLAQLLVPLLSCSEQQHSALDSVQVHDGGLTTAEAEERQQEYGKNKLPESTRNAFLVYLGYMWNPLSWAMEVAAIIAIALLDYADFCLIIALLFLNATISYVEESNADKAIKALTAALAPKCKCLRNGTVDTMESIELVPGDIVVVRLGEIVPADIKLMGETGEDDHPLQVLLSTCLMHFFVSCQAICVFVPCSIHRTAVKAHLQLWLLAQF